MLRWVGSVAAVLILVAAVGIWRLMQGPIELNWLAPYVEAAFDRSDIGLKLAVSGVSVGIERHTHRLDLRVDDVRVLLPGGEPLADFPELMTSFRLGQLLRGRLSPTRVVVERPVLRLIRDAAGTISARIGAADRTAPDLGPRMLEELAGPPQRDAPLGLLRRLSIRGATLIVDDRQSGRIWRADRVDISVNRRPKGARGDVSFAVPLGDSMPELHASYRYLAARQLLDLHLTIDGVQPTAIPPLIPELAELRHVEAPVSGILQTRIDVKQGRAQGSRLDLAVGKGRLHSEWLAAGSLAVESGELHATYAPERNAVRVESLTLDLGGGTRLVLNGTLSGIAPGLIAAAARASPAHHLTGEVSAALKHVPAERIGTLWPPAFSPGGREWTLANIHDGVLDDASVRLVVDLDPAARTADVLTAAGKLRYHGLTVGYFGSLPPVRGVDGTAVFAGHHLDFTPTSGTLEGLKVSGGSLRLTHLGEKTEWLTIDLALAGPLRDALQVIDSKPLHYAQAIGIDPAHVAGRTETRLHFKLPLLAELKLDQIEYGAKATIAGTKIAKVALGGGLSDGKFALDISPTGARLRGTARFDDIPARLDANVPFHPGRDAPHAVYRVGMTLDDAAQHRLGLDIAPDRLRGPVAVDATYSTFAAQRGEATAVLDLRDAALAIPEAGWKKPRGQPGTARIVLALDHDKIDAVREVAVTAPGLAGRLSARLGAERKRLDRVDIRRLAVGGSDLSGTVSRRPDGGWRADIHALRLDAGHLLDDAASAAPSSAAARLAVAARIDRLVFGPHRELYRVNAELQRDGGIWRAGRIAGRFANGHQLSLRFGENGGDRLALRSDDLGASLKLLDIADNIVGGQVSVDGRLTNAGGSRTLRAHVEGRNYTVVRAPGLARLLALPSLTGLASMLSGSGLPFGTLRGDFVYSGSRVAIERLLAAGESLGITAKGWIDLDRDRLDLQGTVAPAYALNSLLGHFPIIGVLGGGSQGLFAANFRLSGPSGDPHVMVNPLSALAPGFLRQLFSPITGTGAPSSPQPEHRAAQ